MSRMNLNRLQVLRRRSRDGDGGGYDGDDRRRMTYTPPYSEPDMRRRYQTRGGYDGEEMEDRRMGFGEQPEYHDADMRRRRRDGTYMTAGGGYDSEPIRFGGMVAMDTPWERKGKHDGRLRREDAIEWVEGLEGADPSTPRGGKWTMEQVKPIAQKHGFDGEKLPEFFAVMNALYADYYDVAKKFNVATPEFFGELTKAWLHDKDAVENKAAMYYEYIVR